MLAELTYLICFLRNVSVVDFLWCLNWERKLIDCIFLPLKSCPSLWTQMTGAAAVTAGWAMDGRRTLAWRPFLPPRLLLGLQVYVRNIYSVATVFAKKAFQGFEQSYDPVWLMLWPFPFSTGNWLWMEGGVTPRAKAGRQVHPLRGSCNHLCW